MFQLMRRVLVLGALILAATGAAHADQVNTIAGTGVAGFSGDGGPATAAELFLPYGIVVAPDGSLYVADTANFRIRRIRTDGVIETVAGNGLYGDDGQGDGGPAISAQLGDVSELALDSQRNLLYLAETTPNRVRRLDLTTGIITTLASIGFPQGIALDPSGNVYVSETPLCRIVKVDATTFAITHVAGSASNCSTSGDGGPASSAALALPTELATDAAGNLFIVQGDASVLYGSRVRRIDAGTGIISTVAGGGVTVPGAGPATDMMLRLVRGVTPDATPGGASRLFISDETQVFVVDLASGQLSVFAGVKDAYFFGGDGGPALEALFNVIGGLAFSPSALYIADANNNRIRAVTLGATDPGPEPDPDPDPEPALTFNGLLDPYPGPGAATPTFQLGRVVPLRFNFLDSSGAVADSADAGPTLSIFQGACATDGAASDPIAVEDAGHDTGWRYDADSRTWVFGWATKPLTAGCYWIQLTFGTAGYPSSAGLFPVALRDR